MFVNTNFERCKYFVCISVCCLHICFLRKAIGKDNGAICALQQPCPYGNLIGIGSLTSMYAQIVTNISLITWSFFLLTQHCVIAR
jgi:hypothetical protein